MLNSSWHLDFCGPFKETPGDKYRYIMVAVEGFSNWPVCMPMKTQTALETAQKLIECVFSVYGCPLSITTDCGRQFESEVLRNVMTLYGIEKVKTTPFHPRANGKVEVFIRTLKQHLRMLVAQDQKDWPKYLLIICQVYRALPTTSTSYSPYEILFGNLMRMPIDLMRGEPPNHPPCLQANKAYKDYPLVLRQHLWKIHKDVRENIHISAQRMKENYDKTSNYIPFQENQKVWLFTPIRKKGQSPKLQTHWSGPWEIISILNDCVARIKNLQNNKLKIVNVERLAPYYNA